MSTMTERDTGSDAEKQPKLPFSETQRIYREGVENLIRPMLDDPQSFLSSQLTLESAALAKHLGIDNDGDLTSHDRARARGVFVVVGNEATTPLRLIPIALPIDYQPLKRKAENSHSMAQIYLNKAYRNDGNQLTEIDETLQQIGDYYFVTREAVRQNIKSAFGDVLSNSENSDKSIVSYEFRKPWSEASKDRASASQSGKLIKIKQLLVEGANNKTLRGAGFSFRDIDGVRRTLKRRQSEVRVPYSESYKRWSQTIAVLCDLGIDRSVKRELIKDIPRGVYGRFSKVGKNLLPPIFINVSEVARKVGFFPVTQRGDQGFIALFLEENCIPLGEAEVIVPSGKQKGEGRRYRFILASDFDEAVNKLESANGERFDAMRKNPVSWYGPKPEIIPNTTQFKNPEKLTSILPLLSVYGINTGIQLTARNLDFSHLMPEPPVTVYREGTRWKVGKDDAEMLQKYLGEQLRR